MKTRNLIFDGIDFFEQFGLRIEDFTETPPAPKVSVVEVPYGNDIDVTEIVDGTVWFSNRKHEFVFNTVLGFEDELLSAFSKVMSRVNGKYGSYSLSWDEGSVYEGRLSVTSTAYTLRYAGSITIEIDAQPFKDKGTHYTQMRSRGGFTYMVESGRMPSVPTFELKYPTTVSVNGEEIELHAGVDSSNLLVLHEGENEVSLVSLDGMTVRTVSQAASKYPKAASNDELKVYQLACDPNSTGEPDVLMTYEWKDL